MMLFENSQLHVKATHIFIKSCFEAVKVTWFCTFREQIAIREMTMYLAAIEK